MSPTASATRLAAMTLAALLPAFAFAQSTSSAIIGSARDESGGALPGVTVDVTSPALIERQKTAVTGDDGRYQVVDLRPGEYNVTFTLPGFQTVREEGVALSASFTATVNAALPVGQVQEQVTVRGPHRLSTCALARPNGRSIRSCSRAFPSGASRTSRCCSCPAR